MSKIKKIYNNEEQSSSSCTSSSLSSDDEVNVQDLKPIKDYITDRKELAYQLFKSVKLEKIRMMLPQTLKQIDLDELKQWCVSELSGMSKKRILSILNGKPLLDSSNTSESDDSGPSLEIISDTEEWLTDDDTFKKEDNDKGKLKREKNKIKGKTRVNRKISSDKSNAKGTCSNKKCDNDKDIKIKKENDKEKGGDSLLDLLELEMRARAIRALIRKEEDVIPGSANPSQTNNSKTTEKDVKNVSPDDIKAKEDCRKQLEKIINVTQVNVGEDEDVVLLVQPTPVVELLSSDSDKDDGGTRINKKLENKRVKKTVNSAENNNENANDSVKMNVQDLKEGKTIALSSTVNKVDINTKSEGRVKISERNVDIKNNTLSISISADNIVEKRKKSRKKSREKSQLISSSSNINEKAPKIKKIDTSENNKQTHDIKVEEINMQPTVSPVSNEKQVNVEKEEITKKNTSKESRTEREKLEELEEIIDLDDYCDDMDIENCDEDEDQEEAAVRTQQENKQSIPQSQSISSPQKSDSLETWASRYYQTDDVQNVIKESKIQSEIRKRLRERQRLSKLKNSPNLNLSSQTPTSTITNPTDNEKIPTGSVEEYLALKRTMSVTADSNDSDNNISTMQENTEKDVSVKENSEKVVSVKENSEKDVRVKENSEKHINVKENPGKVVSVKENSEKDVSVKENLIQNENISSDQECTDNINNIKEAVTLETAETIQAIISDTKNDT